MSATTLVADKEPKPRDKTRADHHAELLAGLANRRKREQSQAEHRAKLGDQDETALTGPPPPTWDELNQVIPLEDKKNPEARSVRKVTTLSPDTVVRHHSDKIKWLSPRRRGMTYGDALAIAGVSIP